MSTILYRFAYGVKLIHMQIKVTLSDVEVPVVKWSNKANLEDVTSRYFSRGDVLLNASLVIAVQYVH
jgi:hypothetical protein